jgi:hypothetical protein
MLEAFLESDYLGKYLPRDLASDLASELEADGETPVADDEWFYMDYLPERNMLTAFTRSGFLCSLTSSSAGDDPELLSRDFELVGAIDDGIAAAAWSPDQSILALVTNNDSIIAMTLSWEVIAEVSIPPRAAGSAAALSWAGDGEHLALYTDDAAAGGGGGGGCGGGMVRIFSKDLDLLATARGVQEGPQGVLKELRPVVAFATAGNLVAVAQAVPRKAPRVALVERNGLLHGSLDLTLPHKLLQMINDPVSDLVAASGVEVTGLFWNASSNLLVVELATTDCVFTQMYYRNNYHWYLKQEWEVPAGGRCLGFDAEQTGRLYLAAMDAGTAQSGLPWSVRVLDVAFDMTAARSPDASVAVVDGRKLMFTPVGRACVPPPMSMYQFEAAQGSNGCLRHTSFWTPLEHSTRGGRYDALTWGHVSLFDDALAAEGLGTSVHLRLAGKGGVVMHDQVCGTALPVSFQHRGLRPRAVYAQSVHVSDGEAWVRVFIVFSGGRCAGDYIGALVTRLDVATAEPCQLIMLDANTQQSTFRITSIVAWADSECMVAVGGVLVSDEYGPSSPFQLHALAWGSGLSDCDFALEHKLDLPEVFQRMIVIDGGLGRGADMDGVEDVESEPVVVGLSARNRLYCNDTLLIAGASSFTWNERLGYLLYTSMGTRPHLHMVKDERLVGHVRGSDDGGGGADVELSMAIGESVRPIERGSRLVACADGAAKTIIQLPRGNLEAFEPRMLVLDRARHMLDRPEPALFACLAMLRKQKVDLNFIVDHNPQQVLQHWDLLLEAALPDRGDYLALFLSGLRGHDTTSKKYFNRPAYERKLERYGEASFQGAVKVNTVCESARAALMRRYLQRNTTNTQQYPCEVNPLLCTYAAQEPPQLEEALVFIRRVAVDQRQSLEESSWAHAAIKYLSFLANHQVLFDAATGMCDFSMARVAARQCQMDPKVYLPLLSGFEADAGGQLNFADETAALSAVQCFARYRIHCYLQRWETAVEWGVRALLLGANGVGVLEVVNLVYNHNLFGPTIPLVKHLTTFSTSDDVPIDNALNLVRALHVSYGQHCLHNKFYKEAVSAFLSCEPPAANMALDASEQLGDWQLSMVIAGRYFPQDRELGPVPTAQKIVQSFRGALMNDSAELEEADFAVGADGTGATAVDVAGGDRPVEVAQLSVDYLDDVETAIGILLSCKRYTAATRMALRANRLDILEGDIAEVLSRGAVCMVEILEARVLRQVALVKELEGLWADPEARVKLVADTEPAAAEINRKREAADRETVADDNGSDFSYASRMSEQSQRSGMSTVSVLSNLSLSSAVTASSVSEKSEFSIEGMEHSLLSRGKGGVLDITGETTKQRKARIRSERKNNGRQVPKGRRDPLGLKREEEVCRQLWELSVSIAAVVGVAADLCDALLVLGGSAAVAGVAKVHAMLNTFAEKTQGSVAPVAPSYPDAWLLHFAMPTVARFQLKPEDLDGSKRESPAGAWVPSANAWVAAPVVPVPDAQKNWWEKTADGLTVLTANKRMLPL